MDFNLWTFYKFLNNIMQPLYLKNMQQKLNVLSVFWGSPTQSKITVKPQDTRHILSDVDVPTTSKMYTALLHCQHILGHFTSLGHRASSTRMCSPLSAGKRNEGVDDPG